MVVPYDTRVMDRRIGASEYGDWAKPGGLMALVGVVSLVTGLYKGSERGYVFT